MTGNPIRDNMHPCTDEERRAGQEVFSLDPSLPTVLIVGGSGGCGTFNSVMKAACRENGGRFPYQIIWQSGKGYAASVSELFGSLGEALSRKTDSGYAATSATATSYPGWTWLSPPPTS